MAREDNEPNGDDFFDDDEDIDFDELFEDDDEDYEFEDEEEDEYEEGQNEEDLFENPTYKKLLERAKREAEEAVVEAIAEGNTDSEVYKGLQRHLAKRDKTIEEMRNALTYLFQMFQESNTQGSESNIKLETLYSAIEDMLDEDGKKVLKDRLEQAKEKQKATWLEQEVQRLKTQGQQGGQTQQNNSESEGDEEGLTEYRSKVMKQLRDIVSKAGYDPDDDTIDYGSEKDPILVRMEKVTKSLENSDQKKPRKRKQTTTRTNPSGSGSSGNTFSGRNLLERGAAKRLQQMKKLTRA